MPRSIVTQSLPLLPYRRIGHEIGQGEMYEHDFRVDLKANPVDQYVYRSQLWPRAGRTSRIQGPHTTTCNGC